NGGAVRRFGAAELVDLLAAGSLVDQHLVAVGVEGKIAMGRVTDDSPDISEGIAVVEPGTLVIGPLDDDIFPRGAHADPVRAPRVRPRSYDAFFDEVGDHNVGGGVRTIAETQERVVPPVIRRAPFFAGADRVILPEGHEGFDSAGVRMEDLDLIARAVEE